MITLLPRLPAPAAERLMEKYLRDAPYKWPGFDAHDLPEATRFTPTGGSPISPKHLEDIRTSILDIAKKNGYGSKGTRSELSNFDAQIAAWLAVQPVFASGEALRDDVWAFITIVMFPDITHWRFGLSPERYLGGVRNTFQRLWLRGKIFDRGNEDSDRWGLLEKLTEDAFLQIIERPSIGSNPILSLSIAEAWVRASLYHGKGAMEALTRRAMLQIRARNEIRCLDELEAYSLSIVLDTIFETPTVTQIEDRDIKSRHSLDNNRIINSEHLAFNGVTEAQLTTAATRLLEEGKRWHLLSPKSTIAVHSLIALDLELTSSERNALQHLLKRIDDVGLLESEVKLVSLAITPPSMNSENT